MKRLYFHCSSPHFFNGPVCPEDGWSQSWATEILETAERLEREGIRLSLRALCAAGVPEEHLNGVLVIDFASEPSVFDALVYAGRWRNGAWTPEWEAVDFLRHMYRNAELPPVPTTPTRTAGRWSANCWRWPGTWT